MQMDVVDARVWLVEQPRRIKIVDVARLGVEQIETSTTSWRYVPGGARLRVHESGRSGPHAIVLDRELRQSDGEGLARRVPPSMTRPRNTASTDP